MENTIHIETGKELKHETLASFRKKMKQPEVQNLLTQFAMTLQENGASKAGPMISATYAMEKDEQGNQVLDMEFLIPINRKVDLPEMYEVKSDFHIVNAIYVRCAGNQTEMDKAYYSLHQYMKNNNLKQNTPAYNVSVNDEKLPLGEEPIIDIYIGVES